MNTSAASHASQEGWVLYDGSCGICRHWASSWENTLQRHGFAIAPLQPPLHLLSMAPLVRGAFDWAYRTFAAHRHQVSRACSVRGKS